MKKTFLISAAVATLALSASIAFAASVNLYNGGFGQIAGNPTQFGVAICNGGTASVSQSVPVSVKTNGQTVSLSSPTPLAAGACSYVYANYSQLGMQAGQSYSVQVTVDPMKTLITNTNNLATYSVQVPGSGGPSAQNTSTSGNTTANVNTQSGNIFTAILHWFLGLFGVK